MNADLPPLSPLHPPHYCGDLRGWFAPFLLFTFTTPAKQLHFFFLLKSRSYGLLRWGSKKKKEGWFAPFLLLTCIYYPSEAAPLLLFIKK